MPKFQLKIVKDALDKIFVLNLCIESFKMYAKASRKYTFILHILSILMHKLIIYSYLVYDSPSYTQADLYDHQKVYTSCTAFWGYVWQYKSWNQTIFWTLEIRYIYQSRDWTIFSAIRVLFPPALYWWKLLLIYKSWT